MKRVGKSRVTEKKENGKSSFEKKFKPKGKKTFSGKNKPASKRYSASDKDESEPQKTKSKAPKLSGEIRLNRYLANAGICSRREADKYIESGIVTINGEVVTELGTKVKYNDEVKFNDAILAQEKKTYILLNKPKDYVTTLDDPHAKKTVIDLIRNGCKERVYPVGRLDKATTKS